MTVLRGKHKMDQDVRERLRHAGILSRPFRAFGNWCRSQFQGFALRYNVAPLWGWDDEAIVKWPGPVRKDKKEPEVLIPPTPP